MRLMVALAAIAALIAAPAARADSFVDVSFSDAQNAWALVAEPCPVGAGTCSVVESTSDGGRSWRRLASLPASAGLLGISREAGMAFGATAYLASNGGRHWQRLPHLALEAVVPAATGTYALAYGSTGCPAECAVTLRRAAAGSGAFTRIPAFRNPSLGFGDTLVGGGANLYAVGFGHVAGGAEGAYSRVAISRDSGRTWSLRGDPCKQPGRPEVDSTDIAAAGRYVALLCLIRLGGAPSIALSSDGGRTFVRLRPPVAAGSAERIAMDAAGDLAIVDIVDGANGHSATRLSLSYDRGRSWHVVYRRPPRDGVTPDAPALLGRSLRWMVDPHTLLRSDDAGRSWQASSVP